MKFIAAAMLGGLVVLAGPAMAQGKDNDMSGMPGMNDKPAAPMQHRISHRTRYKRDYKTDQEEHQATEDLNRQYRGVPTSDMH